MKPTSINITADTLYALSFRPDVSASANTRNAAGKSSARMHVCISEPKVASSAPMPNPVNTHMRTVAATERVSHDRVM